MTKTTKTPAKTAAEAPTIVVAFGLDENGKPRAARFGGADAELVAKAAELMNLRLCTATSPDLVAIADKLVVGRIHANGRGFVPNVKTDLYAKLVEAANAAEHNAQLNGRDADSSSATSKPEPAPSGEQAKETKGPQKPPKPAHGLPRSWDEISVGHLVIADEGVDMGWWEAIVTERNGDILTLRSRDYPRYPKIQRHVAAVALLNWLGN